MPAFPDVSVRGLSRLCAAGELPQPGLTKSATLSEALKFKFDD